MDEKKDITLELADYIINNNCSIRSCSEYFPLSKTTISKYINEYLPKIDKEKYEKVKKIIKSSSVLSIEDKKRINDEYELYMKGYTFVQIAEKLGNSYQQVQRDISNRLEKIDKEKTVLAENKKNKNIRHNESTIEEKIEHLKTIEIEYKLCLEGYTINKIAETLNLNPSTVQRDLALLQVIDYLKYEEVQNILKQNKIEHQIKK